MPFIGLHHPMFPGSPDGQSSRQNNPNGLEATWQLSMAVVALSITTPIVVAILKSCDFRRPTILLILNMTISDTLMCLFYIPLYIMYVLLHPVIKPTFWFCIHAQAFFRMAQGSKLASFCMFSIKMFYNIHCGRKNEKSLKSSLRMSLWIFTTWFVYFIVYHPSIFDARIGIISDLETDGVCSNLTSMYITGKGNEESVLIAGVINLAQLVQVLITSAMLCAIFFSISETSHQKFENMPTYSDIQKVTYVKAGRSTAVLMMVFLCTWIPIIVVDSLLVMDYNVHRSVVHLALNFIFMSPIPTWITMIFAIKSLRVDLGKCCAWFCCYRPPVVENNRRDDESGSDSWMEGDGDQSTDMGQI